MSNLQSQQVGPFLSNQYIAKLVDPHTYIHTLPLSLVKH